MEIAILGLGCFWGPEIKFSKLDGVIKTEVGYCGGESKETNYKEVCTGNTNHAEVVKLDFDPEIISYEKILEYFFGKELLSRRGIPSKIFGKKIICHWLIQIG